MFTARYELSPCITQILYVFITEVESVYSAVRTECLYNTDTFRLYNRDEKCLLRVRTGSLNNAFCASSLKG